ncbi:MAG TPA: polyketide cyclase [Bacteroidales bacterium]|nr:polyketide cyclase [Bacteroidales bacterium]
METKSKTKITVQATVNLPIDKVWEFWTNPKHIIRWNSASDDWHTPRAENDLRVGGKFLARMESKDGTMGFDFEGIYTDVKPNKLIAYKLADEREISVEFESVNNATHIIETFDAETENTLELQRQGWQAILDNFKRYAEGIKN